MGRKRGPADPRVRTRCSGDKNALRLTYQSEEADRGSLRVIHRRLYPLLAAEVSGVWLEAWAMGDLRGEGGMNELTSPAGASWE
jgi:hypothetical protein